MPQAAAADPGEAPAWRAYVQGRAASMLGEADRARPAFEAALAAAPAHPTIAGEALQHAMASGDRALAVRAAQALDSAGQLTPEARLVLISNAFENRDWTAATSQVDGLAREQAFAFIIPVLQAWIAVGSDSGDPLAILGSAGQPLTQSYLAEQRALILLVQGRSEGVEELLATAQDHPRGMRLRIAAAAYLVERNQRDRALAVLAGEEEPILAARALVEERRPLPGAILTPQDGIAEFLIRMAIELNVENLRPVAVSFARIATFMSPGNSTAWIVAAELLSALEEHDAALAALEQVAADDPFAAVARGTRIRLLTLNGRADEALALALASARLPSAGVEEWRRVGDLYTELERFVEAADAYGRGLAVLDGGDAAPGAWGLWLLRGSALERSGNWPAGKAALETAYRLAPDQPLVLNYLGYAQLERRENLEEAERLIREAHRLAPDESSITDSLGWALFLRGDVAEAIPLLEKAAAAEPSDVTINEHLGDAYFAAGRRVEARFAWRAAAIYAEGEAAERLEAKIERGLTPQLAAP